MKRVFLIRHALPQFPEGKKLCLGITDLPLAEEGRRQAVQMAEQLPPVTAVFSSPLSRAVETARAIGMPVTILDGLREQSMGVWDGMCFEEIRNQFPQLYAQRGENPDLLPPGAEEHREGLRRFRRALEQAVQMAPGDLAVVTHAGVMALFLEKLTGQRKRPGYGEILSICWENGIFSIQEET